jgi:predicted nucleic acid-binding Zn ribbon protein
MIKCIICGKEFIGLDFKEDTCSKCLKEILNSKGDLK